MTKKPVKLAKKAVPPASPGVQFVEGNGDKLIVALLDMIARKLDNIQNHTATLVDIAMEEQEARKDKDG